MQVKYSFSLSRLLKHMDKNTFGVVSGYLGKLSLKENKERHTQLKKLVRAKGYGYKEIKGFWQGEETGKLEEEYALFIPKITFEDVISIGKEFEQEALIYGNPNASEDGEIILYAPLKNSILQEFKGIHTNPNKSWDMYSQIKNKSFKFSSVEWYLGLPPKRDSFMGAMAANAWGDLSKCSDISEEEDRQATLTYKVKAKINS